MLNWSFSGIVAAGENANLTGSAMGEIYGTVSQTLSQLPNSQSAELFVSEYVESQLWGSPLGCLGVSCYY